MLDAYRAAGGDPEALQQADTATLVVSLNEVLVAHEIPGLHFEAEPLENGVKARIFVEPGQKIERPVHLCFGVIPQEGLQEIISEYEIGAGAEAEFLAHCSFPNAIRVVHRMDARVQGSEPEIYGRTLSWLTGRCGSTTIQPGESG
jgi:hypothetical protein